MKTKRLFAMLLALAMLLGLMAGCGDGASSEAPVSEASAGSEVPAKVPQEEPTAAPVAEASSEEMSAVEEAPMVGDPFAAMAEEYISYPLSGDNTISMWYYIPRYVEFVDSNYNFNALPAAEAATGVKLEFVEVGDTSAAEQFNLMVASGDMPDLIPASEYYTSGLTMAYEEDIILDINDYAQEYMPNYTAVFDTLSEKTQSEALSDGMMLAFRIIADGSYSGNGFVTRKDWDGGIGR